MVSRMGRNRRPNLPGVAFHLTARLQARAHLFTPALRTKVVRSIERQALRSDARVLAYVVMSNHLHLVVIQGEQALGLFMQPLLRRIAVLVQAEYNTEGHVFEQPYRDRICRDLAHLRNAIAYTHANPVRAGMCRDAADYAWSSFRYYVQEERRSHGAGTLPVHARLGLEAFFEEGIAEAGAARARLMELTVDAANNKLAVPDSNPDPAFGADHHDSAGHARAAARQRQRPGSRPPLEQIGSAVLDEYAADLDLQLTDITGRRGTRRIQRLRATIAFAGACAGYSGTEIAAVLQLTPSAVSRMLVRARPPAAMILPRAERNQ
jgi:putative transposase